MALADIAQSGLQGVQNGRSYLDSLANRYVVKPKSVKGIAGFVFDYEGEADVVMHAEITDHYTETNEAVQDHIALSPDRVTLHGYVGELRETKGGVLGALSTIQNKLSTVTAYLGKYTPGATKALQGALTQAQSVANAINKGLARAKNIVGLFSKSAPVPTKQQLAFAQLESLFKSRQVFVVETPYKLYDNMAIETLRFRQPEETKYMSDIVVTMKQLRFVEVESSSNLDATKGGRAAQQAQSTVDKGKTQGTSVPSSTLYNMFGAP